MTSQTLFEPKTNPNPKNWYIVDDVVMGGRSSGQFKITEEGYAQFSGTVSLENNGGFSSVRYSIQNTDVHPGHTIKIRLKGDGNRYQFRVKNKRNQRYSYSDHFETSGDWQTVTFKLNNLYPSFRGKRLDLPNFNHTSLEEIAFLIGNKVPQSFELTILKIELVD